MPSLIFYSSINPNRESLHFFALQAESELSFTFTIFDFHFTFFDFDFDFLSYKGIALMLLDFSININNDRGAVDIHSAF